MISQEELMLFVESVYADNPRGLIHGVKHSMRLVRDAEVLAKSYEGQYDEEILKTAGLLHGAIHYGEKDIRIWLKSNNISEERIGKMITAAWESQTKAIPISLEGKMLHDAHYMEGGKEFHLLKPFIVGTEMGQSLEMTIEYIKKYMQEEPVWYLPESKEIFEDTMQFMRTFIHHMEKQLYLI